MNNDIIKMSAKKQKVRILRPWEAKKLIAAIPKHEYQTMFKALLFTGMRYIELKRFQKYPEWFDGEFIHLPDQKATRKAKRKQKERWVRLNPRGQEIVRAFINIKKPLPSYVDWTSDLGRWAKYAGISPEYLGPKTTRKTWESWLVFCFEHKLLHIVNSQGHTLATALKHYVNLPFTKEDEKDMSEFVGGWI